MKKLLLLILIFLLLAPSVVACEEGEQTTYLYERVILTSDTANWYIHLGKGETFEARMTIWQAVGSETIYPLRRGTIIFYVLDPSYRMVLDAGRIQGSYEFSFTAKRSGDHILCFDDFQGHCSIRMRFNILLKQ